MLACKVAIVTGGAQGLGRAFVTHLLEKGAHAVIADVNVQQGLATSQELNETFGTGRVTFIKCDVTDDLHLKRTFDKTKTVYGRIDIVVNNAGIAESSDVRRNIAINLTAVIIGSYLATEYLEKGGLIVNISSTAGLTPVAFEPVYAGSKHGVVGFTRSLAMAERQYRITCLCPSFTDTAILQQGPGKNLQNADELYKAVGGVMKVERVVEAFSHLVSRQDNSGGVMIVTPKKMEYHRPQHLKGKL